MESIDFFFFLASVPGSNPSPGLEFNSCETLENHCLCSHSPHLTGEE